MSLTIKQNQDEDYGKCKTISFDLLLVLLQYALGLPCNVRDGASGIQRRVIARGGGVVLPIFER